MVFLAFELKSRIRRQKKLGINLKRLDSTVSSMGQAYQVRNDKICEAISRQDVRSLSLSLGLQIVFPEGRDIP
jgi:hypothetical protein